MSPSSTSSSSASSPTSSDSNGPGGSERPRTKRQASAETIRPSRSSSEGQDLSHRTSTNKRLWRAASDLFSINNRGNGKRNNTRTAPRAASPAVTEHPSSPPLRAPYAEATARSNTNKSRQRKHRRSAAVTDAGVDVGKVNENGRRLSTNFAAEHDRQRHSFFRVERKSTRARNPIASVTTVNARGTLSTPTCSFTSRASPARASTPVLAPVPPPNLDLNLDDGTKENEGPFSSTVSSRIVPTTRSSSSSPCPIARPLPRPPLRVVNANPRTEMEDEFCDIEIKDEDPDDLPAIRPGARGVAERPSGAHNDSGFQDWDANASENGFEHLGFDGHVPIPKSWGIPIAPSASSSRSSATSTSQDHELTKNLTQAYSSVPPPLRVSFRIKPHDKHITFWDFNDGDPLIIRGRLELHDLLLETYAHQSTITVRSYVAPDIRGVEHMEEPEFVLEYAQPRVNPQLDFEFDLNFGFGQGAAGMGHLETIEEVPSWAQSILEDTDSTPASETRTTHSESATAKPRKLKATKNPSTNPVDKNTQIATSDWCSLVPSHPPIPLWAQYFSVPIPSSLFATRETRMFQINASVSYSSKSPSGDERTGREGSESVERKELQAPPVFVSVSHLLSVRELSAGGDWKRRYVCTSAELGIFPC